MSENNICKICGGYIGNAILHATLTSSASISAVTFCPGHTTTDADLASHFPHHVMCPGVGPELVTIPASSSIYSGREQQETLWQIVQEVAERDSTYEYASGYNCPFCDGFKHSSYSMPPFPHEQDCIVTKARELIEWRKAQPQVTASIKKDSE